LACQIIIVASEAGQSIAKDCLNELTNLTTLRTDIYVNHLHAFCDSLADADSEPPSLAQINTILNGLFEQDNARSRAVAGNIFWVFLFAPDGEDNTGLYHSSPHFLESIGYIYSRYQTFLREKRFPLEKRFALFLPHEKDTPQYVRPFKFEDGKEDSVYVTSYRISTTPKQPEMDHLRMLMLELLGTILRICIEKPPVKPFPSANTKEKVFEDMDPTGIPTSVIDKLTSNVAKFISDSLNEIPSVHAFKDILGQNSVDMIPPIAYQPVIHNHYNFSTEPSNYININLEFSKATQISDNPNISNLYISSTPVQESPSPQDPAGVTPEQKDRSCQQPRIAKHHTVIP